MICLIFTTYDSSRSFAKYFRSWENRVDIGFKMAAFHSLQKINRRREEGILLYIKALLPWIACRVLHLISYRWAVKLRIAISIAWLGSTLENVQTSTPALWFVCSLHLLRVACKPTSGEVVGAEGLPVCKLKYSKKYLFMHKSLKLELRSIYSVWSFTNY